MQNPAVANMITIYYLLKLEIAHWGSIMASKRLASLAQHLHKQLYQLQASGAVVWRDVRRSNRAFYAHVDMVAFL